MLLVLRSLMWDLEATATLMGVEATSSTGVLTASGDAVATITGVEAVSSAGSLVGTGDATVALPDLELTSSTGILLAQGDIQQPVVSGGGLWGVKGIGPYTLQQDANVTLIGVELKAKAGRLAASADHSDEDLLLILAACV
jgi:hypothetical protein